MSTNNTNASNSNGTNAITALFRAAMAASKSAKTKYKDKESGVALSREGAPSEDGNEALAAFLDDKGTKGNESRKVATGKVTIGGKLEDDDTRTELVETMILGATIAAQRKAERIRQREEQEAQARETQRIATEREAQRVALTKELDVLQAERSKLDKSLTDGDIDPKQHKAALVKLDKARAEKLESLHALQSQA